MHKDAEWDKCLEEVAQVQFLFAVCELLAFLCMFHNPINAQNLYDKYKKFF